MFAADDMARGQSLAAWAIHEGRAAAEGVDKHLKGEMTLPSLSIRLMQRARSRGGRT